MRFLPAFLLLAALPAAAHAQALQCHAPRTIAPPHAERPTAREPRRLLPIGGGRVLVEALAAEAERKGAAFIYETAATALIQDEAGAVVGVRALGPGARPVEFRACSVVLACGADPLVPPIPGIDGDAVVDAQDLLYDRVAVPDGGRVVIVGGSATGCETAELLVERGIDATIVEMARSIGSGIEGITRRKLVRALRDDERAI